MRGLAKVAAGFIAGLLAAGAGVAVANDRAHHVTTQCPTNIDQRVVCAVDVGDPHDRLNQVCVRYLVDHEWYGTWCMLPKNLDGLAP